MGRTSEPPAVLVKGTQGTVPSVPVPELRGLSLGFPGLRSQLAGPSRSSTRALSASTW